MINNLIDVAYSLLMKLMGVLGIYAAWQLIFELDIPVMFSIVLFLSVIFTSWVSTIEKPKQDAVAVTIVPDDRANAKMVSIGGDK